MTNILSPLFYNVFRVLGLDNFRRGVYDKVGIPISNSWNPSDLSVRRMPMDTMDSN